MRSLKVPIARLSYEVNGSGPLSNLAQGAVYAEVHPEQSVEIVKQLQAEKRSGH